MTEYLNMNKSAEEEKILEDYLRELLKEEKK
jgi:hypothetical protein